MKLSYAVTVCNEFKEIQFLIKDLLEFKREQDEIVVLYDTSKGDPEVESYLRSHSVLERLQCHSGEFDGDFAAWKNRLNSLCSGDFIVQIDADEMLARYLYQYLPTLIESNPEVDLYFFPRVNKVEGLTEEHARKWGWQVDEEGRVNWPDYQGRLYRNKENIRWSKPVHEHITGAQKFAHLPDAAMFAIVHHKDIKRQEKQNEYYESLTRS